jgi:uncharacterized membrane protein
MYDSGFNLTWCLVAHLLFWLPFHAKIVVPVACHTRCCLKFGVQLSAVSYQENNETMYFSADG